MNGFRRIQSHFSLPKPVKLYAFPLELVLDASKTIFFQWEDRSNCPGLSIGMVLDASKAFFFIAKTSQILCISSRVCFGRIQNHFISF